MNIQESFEVKRKKTELDAVERAKLYVDSLPANTEHITLSGLETTMQIPDLSRFKQLKTLSCIATPSKALGTVYLGICYL